MSFIYPFQPSFEFSIGTKTTFVEVYPWTIHALFALNWFTGVRTKLQNILIKIFLSVLTRVLANFDGVSVVFWHNPKI